MNTFQNLYTYFLIKTSIIISGIDVNYIERHAANKINTISRQQDASFKIQQIVMSARIAAICLKCIESTGSNAYLEAVVDCRRSFSKSNSMYSRRHKMQKLYFTFSLSQQTEAKGKWKKCGKNGKEREKYIIWFLLFFWSNVKLAMLGVMRRF